MAVGKDIFPNIAALRLTLSAANTLTFAELLTGVNLGQGTGILIDKIEWFPNVATLQDIDTDGDTMLLALCTSNAITDTNQLTDRRIVLAERLTRVDFGAAASATIIRTPIVRDIAPPIILASPRLYIAGVTAGFTIAAVVDCRLYFRYVQLTAQEYIELAETFVLLG